MSTKVSHVRYLILLLLFAITTINYADRAILSIVGATMQDELGITSVQMGLLFSAFAWAYVIGQIPGGWLLDRFGTKNVYAWSIFLWSIFTLLQATVGWYSLTISVIALFFFRFFVGLAESPAFPGNSRITAAWFPAAERGTAAGIFTSAQYFATVMFAPLMGWVTFHYGWRAVYISMSLLGVIMTIVWIKVIRAPDQHKSVTKAELEYIRSGGGLIELDTPKTDKLSSGPTWADFKILITNRMTIGIFIGQYCINVLSYFFLTWFPIYLVKARGMSILQAGMIASIPAICGFFGGVLGGFLSDLMIKRGYSLTIARKTPLVLGMIMSMTMIICNYTQNSTLIIMIMAMAYFGKGFGAIGWAVISDIAPQKIAGLCGGVFNACGNTAGITTPIVIGFILSTTGSFSSALAFVAAHAALAVFCYLVIVGKIERMSTNK
ncbi:Major facilitator superfamily [Bartonella choladocola]|uniref:MFS transporter n=1 Tax=Bartonella TaxID=773 RepID=UPI0018DE95BB|nr:MFS transporter [Bartonella choladocola]MBI0140283.1 MFS transporter [Bartonella choladocola]